MVFSSLEFLFIFLPLFLGVYYLVPQKKRNWPLLLGSIAFYAYGARNRPWILLLFLGMLLFTYQMALLIERKPQRQKALVGSAVVVIFGSLLSFKYTALFGEGSVALPLAMSFYSFQLAAYLLDVSRHEIKAEHNIRRLFTAMLMFPKLISGPLTPYGSLSHQLNYRSFSWERFHYGLQDFIFGLSMKCLLADQIGGLWHQLQAIGFASVSTPLAWMGMVAFSLQLYFDFYGYSIMAIGLGRMLGFRLPKNFVLPYTSRSVTEFWRRWHMTLGRWFLDYVYIPLGGSRKGQLLGLRNLLIVWILTGIWHGATINFLLWGLFIFLFIALEKLWIGSYLERSRIFSHIYLLFIIMLSWMFFAITDLSQIAVYFGRLFPFFGGEVLPISDFFRLGQQYAPFLLLGIFASTTPFMQIWDKIRQSSWSAVLLLILFWLSIYDLSAGLNDPFLYFSF